MHILKKIILLCTFLLPVSIEPISRQQRRSTASYLNLRRIQKARSPRAARTRRPKRPTSLKLRRAGQRQPGRTQPRAQRARQQARRTPARARRQPQRQGRRTGRQPRRAPGRPTGPAPIPRAIPIQPAPITPIIPPVITPPQQPPTFIPAQPIPQEPSIKWIQWQMPLGGAIIDGRQYTQHALERMAPNIEQVRTELQARAIARGYQPGSREFNNYIKPRDIPPATVEHIIATTMPYPGRQPNTLVHETQDFRVVLGINGTVVTVIEKE